MVDTNVGIKQRVAGVYVAGAHEQIAVDNTVGGVALTASKYQKTVTDASPGGARLVGAQRAVITVEDQDLRYTYDGTAPTATAGHLASAAAIITIVGYANIAAFRAIRTGAANSEINVTYEF